jgi:hypothetical protein
MSREHTEFSDRVAESRRTQGLPRHIEDPATLARVAQLLRSHRLPALPAGDPATDDPVPDHPQGTY